ncbi:MAG: hypothetical protein OXK77_11580 [Gemmatimonadota bacterium]|nr:hypothetical protein [Gemmatimonadota bacterium]MDE2865463.1 hypothetical protein [Gemmatimonadota bacterium]MYG21771.1 hypothetical protein [Gemmatimonadota bacterium]MYJ40410.1 hypothetical protein [Gemmatimonadota bacterium]
MTTSAQTYQPSMIGAITRAVLPWCLLFVIAKPLLSLRWPPPEWSGTLLQWSWFALGDGAFVLPFLAFAVGVTLKDLLGYSRRAFRSGLVIGIAMSALSYSLAAWAVPMVHHRHLVSMGAETADVRRFGPRTPTGILENLRFVQENPPSGYTLEASSPERFPPNVLGWQLHLPVAVAVFGLVNVFLGMLSAELTVDLRRGRRRNALLVLGLVIAVAFQGSQVVAAPIGHFIGSGGLRSGILAAWLPLSVPLAGCLLLPYFIRSRRYG